MTCVVYVSEVFNIVLRSPALPGTWDYIMPQKHRLSWTVYEAFLTRGPNKGTADVGPFGIVTRGAEIILPVQS